MNQPDSIKLSWLRNPALAKVPSAQTPLMQENPQQLPTWDLNSSEIDESELFQKLGSLIKDGTWKAIAQIKQFLENDSEDGVIHRLRDRDGQTLLHLGGSEGNYEIVQMFLKVGMNPNTSDYKGQTPLHACIVDSGCRCSSCSEVRVTIIKSLINAGAPSDPEDKDGNTPLYYCAVKLYCTEAKTLLTLGASLYHRNLEKRIATMLAEFLPEALRNELDACIGYSAVDPLKLEVNFRLLLQIDADNLKPNRKSKPGVPPPETDLLQCLLKAKTGHDLVLMHPVVEAFLHFKWMVVRKLFFALRSIYFLFLMLYTILMFRIYSNKCIDDYYFGQLGDLCPTSDFDRIGALILYGVVGIIVLSEFYKLYTNFDSYFSEKSTGWLWWILCIAWAGTLIPIFGPPPLYYHYPVAAASVIFSWMMNLVQLGRMPWFAVHVGILFQVVTDFVRLLLTFLTVLIAFTLGFCILLNENPNFDNNAFALFKTFMMMKGDLDYEGVMNNTSNSFLDFPEYSVPAHIIYTVFVIVVTMVLTALLIGLAVKDIEEAIRQTKVNRSIRLIREIGVFESLIRNKIFTCWMAKWLCKWYSIERTKEIVDYQLTFSPLLPDDTTLPADIKNSFVPYFENGVGICQRENHRRRLKA